MIHCFLLLVGCLKTSMLTYFSINLNPDPSYLPAQLKGTNKPGSKKHFPVNSFPKVTVRYNYVCILCYTSKTTTLLVSKQLYQNMQNLDMENHD